jgi:hypothetical protein
MCIQLSVTRSATRPSLSLPRLCSDSVQHTVPALLFGTGVSSEICLSLLQSKLHKCCISSRNKMHAIAVAHFIKHTTSDITVTIRYIDAPMCSTLFLRDLNRGLHKCCILCRNNTVAICYMYIDVPMCSTPQCSVISPGSVFPTYGYARILSRTQFRNSCSVLGFRVKYACSGQEACNIAV